MKSLLKQARDEARSDPVAFSAMLAHMGATWVWAAILSAWISWPVNLGVGATILLIGMFGIYRFGHPRR